MCEYGGGCDCSSSNELKIAHAVGCFGNEIMFSSNHTPAEEYAYVNKLGGMINIDDITHNPLLRETIKDILKTICLRYNPGGKFGTGIAIMGNPAQAKYGMTKTQIFEAVSILKNMGVTDFGLHAFLSGNSINSEYHPALAKTLFELAAEITQKLVNLSDGIGIPYHPDEAPNDIMTIGNRVREIYEEILTPNHMDHVAIYTELGR